MGYGRAHSAPSRTSEDTAGTKAATTSATGRRNPSNSREDELVLKWIQKVSHLANIDSCMAAADALATASTPVADNEEEVQPVKPSGSDQDAADAATANSSLTRLDPTTGLVHTSVLISPNGTLLLVPPNITREKLPFSSYFQSRNRPVRRTPKLLLKPPRQQQSIRTDPSEEDKATDTEKTDVTKDDPVPTDTTSVVGESEETESQQGASGGEESPNEGKASSAPNTPGGTDENVVTKTSQQAESENDAVEDAKVTALPLPPPPQPSLAEMGNNNSFDSADSRDSIFSELLWNSKGEYAAAVFLGNDLDPQGDLALNGFSAKGWSLPATSFALRQTKSSLDHWADFCHSVILSRKESAVMTTQACDKLRSQIPRLGGCNPPGSSDNSSFSFSFDSNTHNDADWELVFDPKSDFVPTMRRAGPLLGEDQSSLNKAIFMLEDYYSQSAEAESMTWRQATVQESAVFPVLRRAIDDFQTRMTAREQALEESSKRARLLEDHMNKLKKERDRKWEQVYKAEEKVTRRMEALWKERTRQREKARLNQLRENNPTHVRGKSNEHVWDVVASLSDNMDSTSFEPVQLPDIPSPARSASSDEGSLPSTLQTSAAMEELNRKNSNNTKSTLPPSGETSAIARESMEQEMRLPELRATAMDADDAIEECSFQLLTVLSNLDTTRRSARVAAETALLAAANAQAATLKDMVKLERKALQSRLRHLDQLEEQFTEIDVRADLNNYISADKKDRGGQSHLGDDDDGGIACALSILSCHVDSALHDDASSSSSYTNRNDEEDEIDNVLSKAVTRAQIEKAVSAMFEQQSQQGQPSQDSESEPSSSDTTTEVDKAVDLLCTVAKETSVSARRNRSTICYSLNGKRSGNAELKSEPQFDGLVRVFDAMLTSCADEDDVTGGMSNAKMLMMLAQTFYLQTEDKTVNSGSDGGSLSVSPSSVKSTGSDLESRKGRSRRLYIKSRLTHHKIWSKDEFWDVALKQQISESLTQSGVIMSNFERSARAQRGGDGEYRKSRKIKWHDLSLEERVGAASQVHAVVFAQLGALAHSMIEFGCGLQRSCAFVRRMAVRHQLPSAQRTMLLQHLMARWEDEDEKSKQNQELQQ